tara:strand:+ start:179 stop:697 length:519 start_codon:yes stop_codon:yes gene_type:complete
MAHYYRGNCLSESNQDNAISQTNFLKFKNRWVTQECYLRSLFEKGEVPTLTTDDQIFIPEDFSPEDKHKDFYRDKFNTHQKNWVNRMVKGVYDQDISKDKNKRRIKFSKMVDHFYENLAKPTNVYAISENLQTRMINDELDEYQKTISFIKLFNLHFEARICEIQVRGFQPR